MDNENEKRIICRNNIMRLCNNVITLDTTNKKIIIKQQIV